MIKQLEEIRNSLKNSTWLRINLIPKTKDVEIFKYEFLDDHSCSKLYLGKGLGVESQEEFGTYEIMKPYAHTFIKFSWSKMLLTIREKHGYSEVYELISSQVVYSIFINTDTISVQKAISKIEHWRETKDQALAPLLAEFDNLKEQTLEDDNSEMDEVIKELTLKYSKLVDQLIADLHKP